MSKGYIIKKVDKNFKSTVIINQKIYTCQNMAILECGLLNDSEDQENIYYYLDTVSLEEEISRTENFEFDLHGVYYLAGDGSKPYSFDVKAVNRGGEWNISSINYKGSDIEDLDFSKEFKNALKNTAVDYMISKYE